MSTVKFECPSCGQNMECDRGRSGDVIHCAGCGAELRIPFSSTKAGLSCIERAELIIPGAAPSAPSPKDLSPPPSVPVTQEPAKKPDSSSESLDATCPVCQAHLRLDPQKCSTSNGQDPPPTAELVQSSKTTAAPQKLPQQPHPNPHPEHEAQETHHLSFEERERQIAEGRKAHPIQVNPAQKPRLDYILSGGAAPAPGQPQDKEKARDDKSTGDCHNDSFSE